MSGALLFQLIQFDPIPLNGAGLREADDRLLLPSVL